MDTRVVLLLLYLHATLTAHRRPELVPPGAAAAFDPEPLELPELAEDDRGPAPSVPRRGRRRRGRS